MNRVHVELEPGYSWLGLGNGLTSSSEEVIRPGPPWKALRFASESDITKIAELERENKLLAEKLARFEREELLK